VNESVPPPLARIAMRLLKKAPDARFQSALDLGWALEQAAGPSAAHAPAGSTHHADSAVWWRSRWAAGIAAAAVTAGVLLGLAQLFRDAPREAGVPRLTQFTWTLPAGTSLDSPPMVSPDSRHIAFVGRDASGSRLFVRALGSREAALVAGTEGAAQPFWAPDSRSLGFFARGQLMTVAWPGGAPVAIASAPQSRGGTWSPAGTILFAPDVILAGINRVPAAGGAVTPATVLETSKGDASHWWPLFLPDGAHFLYSVKSTDDERLGVYVGGGDRPASAGPPLFRSSSDVVLAPLPGTMDGALFSVVDGRIEVRRFDPTRLTVASDARTIGLSAGGSTLHHPVMLSASRDVLAFSESVLPAGRRLECVHRNGERLRLWEEPEAQNWPRLSPDGRRLARQRVDPLRNNPDIWVEDLERGTKVRVTTAVEPDIQPVWSADGRHLAYVSGHLPGRPGRRTLHVAAADGTGITRNLSCPAEYCEPADWSRDGRALLVNVRDARGWDVWTVSIQEGGGARPLLAGAYSERDARFSPDGRHVAYVSEESGRPEVSVQALSGPPRRFAISSDGGNQPVWRRDGAELFFVDPQGNLRSVSVQWAGDGTPTFGLPTRLSVPPVGFGHWGTQYDVSPDGRRIYFLRENEDQAPREIHVVMGWPALLD
jgi:eukaryotic-like serine/threonine-protein kinase